MKKIFFAAAFLVFGTVSTFAQREVISTGQAPVAIPTSSGPAMKFDTDVLDYGTVVKGSNGQRVFTFKNTGDVALKISNAQGSCGCTVPTFPKDEIQPGQTGEINVKYDTNREGDFTKYVTLTTNAPGQESYKLTIKGKVIKEEDAVPVNKSSGVFGG